MPFKSEKQRRYLWANEPEIARDWSDKYGSRVKKANGGIGDFFTIPPQHMSNWGDALATPKSKSKPWSTTPEYHQWGAQDLTEQKSKQLANIPYGGNLAAGAFEMAAPFLAAGASPFYDIPQAFWKYNQDPGKYETNNKWDKINAYFPDLQGTTVSGILNAIDMEDPLSAAWNRGKGAAKPFINRMKSGWDAIKSEFGGSAEAADLSDMIPKDLEKTIEEGMRRYKESNEISPALRKAIEEGTSYNEWDMIPSEYPYAGIAQTIPYKGSRFSIKDMKNIGFNLDEEDPYVHQIPERIRGVPRSIPRKMGMLERLRNRFYKPATSAAGGYSVAQLNRMNALGGYYSEPVRQQRRDRRSVSTLLARKAAADAGIGAFSPIAQKKLNILTMGSRPGHYDRPGGNGGVQGTDTPASGAGGWGPGAR